MATSRKVTCINKSDRQDIHECIASIGGINADGTPWKLTEVDAIKDIEHGTGTFYVSINSQTVNVVIAKSSSGRKYLKTEADSTTTNNLLSLSECR